jgi:hypothetical protein
LDDGIVFDPEPAESTEIRKDAGYSGVRIDCAPTSTARVCHCEGTIADV